MPTESIETQATVTTTNDPKTDPLAVWGPARHAHLRSFVEWLADHMTDTKRFALSGNMAHLLSSIHREEQDDDRTCLHYTMSIEFVGLVGSLVRDAAAEFEAQFPKYHVDISERRHGMREVRKVLVKALEAIDACERETCREELSDARQAVEDANESLAELPADTRAQ